jgi:hypothetical protein
MEYLQLAISAAVITTFVQFIKSTALTSPFQTKLLVVALSLFAGVVYYFFHDTPAWLAGLDILGLANTAYLFIVKPLAD